MAFDTIVEWGIPLLAALGGVIVGCLVMFWFSKRALHRIIESDEPVNIKSAPFIASEEERSSLRSVVGEMRLNALMVEETSVIWSWAPFERRAIDSAQWLYPSMPPVVAEALARANRKVTEYNSIAEFTNRQDQHVQDVAQEARTALIIAAQRLEEYLTDFQMDQGRRGLRIPRPGRRNTQTSDTADWMAS